MRLTHDSENATDILTGEKIGKMLKKPKLEKAKNFSLDDVQKEVKRLEDRAMTLKNKAIVRTDTNVENIRLEVEIIKITTQNTERMMIEELRPIMNETRNLAQETRWKMDVYAKATKSSIPINGTGIRKPGTNVNAMSSVIIDWLRGSYLRYMSRVTRDLEEEFIVFVRVMTRNSSATPKLCEEQIWWKGDKGMETIYKNDKFPEHRGYPCVPVWIMGRQLLGWRKTPIRYDLSTDTDISIT